MYSKKSAYPLNVRERERKREEECATSKDVEPGRISMCTINSYIYVSHGFKTPPDNYICTITGMS